MIQRVIENGYKASKRIVIAVIGGTLLLLGLAMIVLPGPAVVVLPAGLVVLSLEFAWARRWLARVRRGVSDASRRQRMART